MLILDGYMNGLLYLLAEQDMREALPLYYIFGAKDQPKTVEEFSMLRKRAFDYHKTATGTLCV